ncbi:relaxase/mobilization nuclease domain-containing protein [Salipiger thiooxidans]|uniref:relaxase/mobilization nuclease domain-containing protein n=1 Tax=Salipiger thiooxidans TaxID=282683 RepID=UPI001A8FD686|nr:relaxase/mobilization nuclease domain-containing protein [Salipiger thiooxidans]MBN8189876.1 relaxase/mobilization nuclease domain-containing protein [Salipiger thiooxidans]
MRLNDAVHDVTGDIFRDGWSRIRGSMQGLQTGRQRQLVRAAAGHRAAVFKAIRSGGTHTQSQLKNQLDYLTTKSSHIVDSSGFLDGKARLEATEIKDLTERFSKRWSAGFKPKLGQTTHMLMSYPIGTKGEDVRDITANVAERFFQSDTGHFDYIIAVHEDRDHPHAHIVLNRRSQEGEFFFLGRDHRFNYDDFRIAMVEEAEKFGVRLEATRRLDRGVVHYSPRTREVYAAKDEGRAAEPRPRVGADLTHALEEIANTRIVYHALAAEASSDDREDIAAALFRAGEILAKGGKLTSEGGVYMAEDQSFEELRTRYADQVERVQSMIAEKPEAERPRLERSLNEIQARLAHMQPLGLRSVTLTEKPSEGGVYSETNIDAARLDRLRDPEVRAQVDTALRGTGISSSVVVARMETGAQNAALERQWIADDLDRVASRDGLNLERRADLEAARDTLNRAHVQLGVALERAGVLREDGVVDDRTVTERFHYHPAATDAMERAIRQDMRSDGLTDQQIEARDWEVVSRAEQRIEEEQRGYLDTHPELLPRPGDVIDRREPYRERITDEDRAREITREVDRIMEGRDVRTPVADAVTEEFRDRYPDMPSHLARGLGATYAAVTELRDTEAIDQVRRENELRAAHLDLREERLAEGREADAAEARPVANADIRRIIDHERAGNLQSPFQDDGQRLSYRVAVERELDAAQIDRLRNGDADVLRAQIEDRLDRLYVAKTYLQSDAATANSEATRAVVEEIADREFELQRTDLVEGESERGETH